MTALLSSLCCLSCAGGFRFSSGTGSDDPATERLNPVSNLVPLVAMKAGTTTSRQQIIDGVAKKGVHVELLFPLLNQADFETEHRPGGKRGPLKIQEWCQTQGLACWEVVSNDNKGIPRIALQFSRAGA